MSVHHTWLVGYFEGLARLSALLMGVKHTCGLTSVLGLFPSAADRYFMLQGHGASDLGLTSNFDAPKIKITQPSIVALVISHVTAIPFIH